MTKKVRNAAHFAMGLFFALSWWAVGQATDATGDGPHVFWQNDTTATVIYIGNDEIERKIFTDRDTLRFRGFCGDSASTYVAPSQTPFPPQDRYKHVSRFFAISDIHGDYEHLTEILINTGIVDSNLSWSFGEGHVVINGDVFDRGDKVTECLWLIHRLEREAKRVGGWVHFILGNHELMVLRGDLRYVHEKYMHGLARRNSFTYKEMFGPDTELGRWLRSKNVVQIINDILFVHGGLAPELMREKMQIKEINDLARRGLDYTPEELKFNDTIRYLYGSEGPLWYRGFMTGREDRYDAATTAQIDSLLQFYQATRIVVGHTQVSEISALHDGRIIAIDVIVEDLGHQMALYWEAGRFYRVSANGELRILETE